MISFQKKMMATVLIAYATYWFLWKTNCHQRKFGIIAKIKRRSIDRFIGRIQAGTTISLYQPKN